jgi:hypothetical protein
MQRYCLVQKLNTMALTAAAADTDSDLPNTQAIPPKPDYQH